MSHDLESSISGVDENRVFSELDTRDDTASFNYDSYLVISYENCKVGAVIYRQNRIELFAEMYEFYDFHVISLLIKQLEPGHVVISTRTDFNLMKFLKKFASNSNSIDSLQKIGDSTETTSSVDQDVDQEFINSTPSVQECESQIELSACFVLHILSARLFQFEQCKNRILAMNLPQIANVTDNQERFIYLTSHINFTETNVIKALGVLLFFIEKNTSLKPAKVPLNCNTNLLTPIDKLNNINLDYFVRMDQHAFEALEIFQSEWHPSVSKKGIYKKEGLSLYGIFNSCASKVGSYQLKKLFLQPVTDYDVLQERLNTIEFLINPASVSVKETFVEYLKNIKDLTPIMNRFKSTSFIVNDFQVLLKVLSSAIAIRNTALKLNNQLDLFQNLSKNISIELENAIECLNNVIDFEKSTVKFVIRKGIDDELDNLKFIFNQLPKTLTNSISDESIENDFLSKNLQHVTIIYIPQLGFLIALPLIQVQNTENIDKHGFELIFCADDSAYYKNSKTKEFDSYFGDIMSQINDRTHSILICLRDYILDRVEFFNLAVMLCAQLDSMIALTQTAINYNYVKPVLTCNGRISIVEGRHPLYELITESFTANDFHSDDEQNKIAILFGPNSSGKSVFLKQVSLIVYLSHVGSYVPAKFAEITLVDQIFTRIRTPESISTHLSSFKHDLNQMIMATKFAKKRSFVIIDFFGKGTLSIDGYALLSSCINFWIQNENKPHLMVASQFNLIASIPPTPSVRFFAIDRTTFRLIENVNYEVYLENLETFDLPEPIKVRARKLSTADDFVQVNAANAFPSLITKQNKYVEIGHFIMNETSQADYLNQISLFVKSIFK